ncbi:MAG: hypothetical protein CMN30_26680 [Sandaracinus sp.]|nr:hypothetical protein [Sandaracinus sp.]|tara:strand:- start:5014 stop:6192 length:1179 start_codon:yes stop_codon:yes gene_type:complete
MRVRRARPERFGAMVATEEPPALIAVDRVLARRMGIDGDTLWIDDDPGLDVAVLQGPTEVHLAVTDRCPAGCTACYADATPEGHEPTLAEVCARLDQLATAGAFSVALGGGEGALREDLPDVVAHARSVGLTPTLTTSGLGLTPARARALRGLAQVNVSWDGPAELYHSVRGYDGARGAERTVRILRDAGIPVGLNTVLTRTTMEALERIGEGAAALDPVELQLLRLKPSGRGRLHYLALRPPPHLLATLPEALERLSRAHAFAVRIDCALVPFLGRIDVERLRTFGVNGCEAGRSLMTVGATGTVGPCSFWGAADAPLGASSWADDPTLGAFRAYAAAPPAPCADCPVRAVCRGGCRIVSRHLTGDAFAPDPECPRVRRHQGSAKVRSDAT